MTVTTIQTVTGKVWHINPPRSVILTLENNTNQEFKIPQDQKFNVNGQMVDAFALKKGMTVSATKIVEVPTVVSSQEKSVTGTMPKEVATQEKSLTSEIPPGPLPDAPLLIVKGEPTAVPAETETPAAPAEPISPTESHFPWIWFAVALLVVLFAALFIRAKSRR